MKYYYLLILSVLFLSSCMQIPIEELQNGTNGIDGINGTNGIDGINGINGIDGINGTNAYNITYNITNNITNNITSNDGTGGWTNTTTTTSTTLTTNISNNLNVLATRGAEKAPLLNSSLWTLGNGWANTSMTTNTVLVKNSTAAGGTATPTTSIAPVIGVTYEVTVGLRNIVGNIGFSFGGFSYTSLNSGNTTYYLTATTTDNALFTPASAAYIGNITYFSVKNITNNIGDTTIEGNLIVRSPVTFNAPFASTVYSTVTGTQAFYGTASTGQAIYGYATGAGQAGRFVVDTTGTGLYVSSSGGGVSVFDITTAAANTILTTLTLRRFTSGTAAPGLGAGITFQLEDSIYLTENAGMIASVWENSTNGSERNALVFHARTGGAADTERMRISGNGNVGIGTTSPSSLLNVNGSGNFSGTNAQLFVNGSEVCTASNGLCASGNRFDQELNTTNNVKFQQINNTGNAYFRIDDYYNSTGKKFYFSDHTTPNWGYLSINSETDLKWSGSFTTEGGILTSGSLSSNDYVYAQYDIYSGAAGGDLWLGNATQANALFRAYTTGQVNAKNVTVTNGFFVNSNEVCTTNNSACNGYAELWNKADSGFQVINLSTPDTYVQITNLTQGNIKGITTSGGNITIGETGIYLATVSISLESGGYGEFGIKIFQNGTGINSCYSHQHLAAGNSQSSSISCILSLSANDVLNVRIDDHASPVNDPTINSMNFNVVKISS